MVELVSVVIPAYNVQEYISECIESIIGQTYRNIEIVIVDDGSIDDTLMICKEYEKKDDRIVVYHQENQGVVRARKNATEHIKGQYVVYVDSDDYVNSDYVEKLLDASVGCDIVVSGYFQGSYNKVVRGGIPTGVYKEEDLRKVYENMIFIGDTSKRGILGNMCSTLVKSELARKVFKDVDENIYYGEDGEFLYKYLLKCNSVAVADYCGYFYRQREKSSVHYVYDDYLININRLYMSLKKDITLHYKKELLLKQLERWIVSLLIDAPRMMGFQKHNWINSYIYPYAMETNSKKIIVYGAGKVGCDYVRYITTKKTSELVLWVDKKWETIDSTEIPVVGVSQIYDVDYDYIVIAVKNKSLMLEIKNELLGMGVELHKILWKDVDDIYFI